MKPSLILPIAALASFTFLLACTGQKVTGIHQSSGNIAAKEVYQAAPKKTNAISWLDFQSGVAKAARENKILLVDAYTDWCGWCKVMDRNTYTNDTVLQVLNEHFVTVKFNPEKDRKYYLGKDSFTSTELHAWMGYGRTFGYPTTYFLMKPGVTEERYAVVGYNEPWDFRNILAQVVAKRKK